MTNPLKGEMMITLGKKEYKTRLTVDSIIKIETELNDGILGITHRLGDANIRVTELRTVLLHSIRGGGNDLKEKDINQIIADAGIVNACRAVAELLANTLVAKEEDEQES